MRHRRWVLGGLYGITTAYLLALWGSMFAARWLSLHQGGSQTAAAFQVLRGLALGYIALAAFLYGICILCLVFSYRNARTRGERNQVRWIMWASLIASVLIAYLLVQAWIDPATLGRGNAAWPMFGVSLLYTMAYAFSITRYKLMQVEEIINRSAVYFAFSLTAGLIYSGVLLVSGKLIGDQLVLDSLDHARGGCGGAFGHRGADPVGSGPRAVSAGDRPAVLPREVQIRPGDAEDEPGGGQLDRPADAGPAAARGGGRGPAAGMGGALPGRRAGAGVPARGQPTARRPTSDASPRTIRW